ncbi:MAG TPA: hypothetical protein VFI62_12285, partial [Burkholderiales bacterium]|nr:hypothetical protein [Burkholderiales bacterium]
YKSWSAEVQQAVDFAAQEATTLQHTLAAQEDETVLASIDPRHNEVVTLTPAEHDAFVQAVAPVLAKHRGSLDAKLFDYLAAF